MSCYRPVTAFKPDDGGSISFVEKKGFRQITIKCGQCIGCRLERQETWAIRCWAESKMYTRNSFVTLTYNEENYPQHGSLNYRHFQLFMKRLRKEVGPVRFFMCGEYGEQLTRPHYHALLFGLRFGDEKRANSIRATEPVFRSPTLEKLWPYGFSSIGSVTYSSARYCATYALKKISGDLKHDYYSRVDPSSGELVFLEPEFSRMSLRPGIGARWLERYWRDIYLAQQGVIVGGKKKRVPRFFDEKMKILNPMLIEEVLYERHQKAMEHSEDQTRERLAVREQVELARVKFNKERVA